MRIHLSIRFGPPRLAPTLHIVHDDHATGPSAAERRASSRLCFNVTLCNQMVFFEEDDFFRQSVSECLIAGENEAERWFVHRVFHRLSGKNVLHESRDGLRVVPPPAGPPAGGRSRQREGRKPSAVRRTAGRTVRFTPHPGSRGQGPRTRRPSAPPAVLRGRDPRRRSPARRRGRGARCAASCAFSRSTT